MPIRNNIFALCLIGILVSGCVDPQDIKDALPARTYSIPSESMAPTLMPGDVITGVNVTADEVERGDILIVRTERNGDWVVRLIGLPGDTVAMEEGVIVLNGEMIEQIPDGEWENPFERGNRRVPIYLEQLPGQPAPHRIIDLGVAQTDTIAPVQLADDRYFFLGDNRDNSADSRFMDESFGLGLVSGSQIRARIELPQSDSE